MMSEDFDNFCDKCNFSIDVNNNAIIIIQDNKYKYKLNEILCVRIDNYYKSKNDNNYLFTIHNNDLDKSILNNIKQIKNCLALCLDCYEDVSNENQSQTFQNERFVNDLSDTDDSNNTGDSSNTSDISDLSDD